MGEDSEDEIVGRLGGILAGWLLGTAPLVLVNVASNLGLLDQQEATLASALALLAGVILGGAAAGALGARSRHGGGAAGAAVAGGGAACLYVVTLLVLIAVAASLDQASSALTVDSLGLTLAMVCLAALLMLVALATGALVGARDARGMRSRSPHAAATRDPAARSAPRPILHPVSRPVSRSVPQGEWREPMPSPPGAGRHPASRSGPPPDARGRRDDAEFPPTTPRYPQPSSPAPPRPALRREAPSRPMAPSRPAARPPDHRDAQR